MIREIGIENFKSVQDLTLELGRVNVFIGENGSGKSNILEGIALAAAAGLDKLDNEFLAARGIRVTEPQFMRAAFDAERVARDIKLSLKVDGGVRFEHELKSDESLTYPRWQLRTVHSIFGEAQAHISRGVDAVLAALTKTYSAKKRNISDLESMRRLVEKAALATERLLPDFLIYSPENSSLRVFQAEGQILPLGIRGEGLFAHLKALSNEKGLPHLGEIMDQLSLIDWFERFDVPDDLSVGERTLRIRDRYLAEGAIFDQRSANEGFLFLLFYFALFISHDTPAFFAIDNVDTSLNPKLCSALVHGLVELAGKHEKQVIFTTHNPAVLDGIDLNDDDQRLFVIYRNKDGHTKARRILPPKPLEGEAPVKLSEAFLRGYIGGLPQNF